MPMPVAAQQIEPPLRARGFATTAYTPANQDPITPCPQSNGPKGKQVDLVVELEKYAIGVGRSSVVV